MLRFSRRWLEIFGRAENYTSMARIKASISTQAKRPSLDRCNRVSKADAILAALTSFG